MHKIGAYRLGFAASLAGMAAPSAAAPPRQSLELLDAVFDYLDAIDVRVHRLASWAFPAEQLDLWGERLAELGAKARRLGLRLSFHASGTDEVERGAALLDALGLGPDAVVVTSVRGLAGEETTDLGRWAATYESLSERARRRLALEHDEVHTLADVLLLHRETGVPIVYSQLDHRYNPSPATFAEAYASWAEGTRPKAHLSSEATGLSANASAVGEVVPAWDAVTLLDDAPGPVDVLLEAGGKGDAVLRLRAALAKSFDEVAKAEDRRSRRKESRRRHPLVRMRSGGRRRAPVKPTRRR